VLGKKRADKAVRARVGCGRAGGLLRDRSRFEGAGFTAGDPTDPNLNSTPPRITPNHRGENALKFFHDIPIKRKVILVILLANVVTLVLALLAGLIYQRYHNREVITRDLLAQGEIVGANSTAALIFNDAGTAAEKLAPLKSERHVLAAALYLPDRNCLAAFGTVPEQLAEKDAAAAAVFREEGPHLALIQPVMLKARKVGTLYLRFDYRAMQADWRSSCRLSCSE
jgi:hypothetical protein